MDHQCSDLEVVHTNDAELEVDHSNEAGLEAAPSHGKAESLATENLQPYHPNVPHGSARWGLLPYHPGVSLSSENDGPIPVDKRSNQAPRRKRGQDEQHDSDASPAPTQKGRLDASPTTPSPDMPTLPTSHFVMPLNQTQQINTCVTNDTLSATWECIGFMKQGIDLFDSTTSAARIIFDDYSVRPAFWRYGPQPPDFNRALGPMPTGLR
ncbi:uncharacterized protein Z518_09082 [Rhinocladiella mackenziei CBS 650.93]|uniref:DUF7820 domain-containing protein n=1 Tax=Rhinocladiella mackenziei CBS 650.93 TaxID=1442369 RepID=A0A0D2FH48_9EURO|nr:uncharacterized protein Z518_09082 [Rhinocladiella mackenziei CBS 650.93]KIX01357.1 hypothetical protein Z518_09082 [Rhinocladiella mackenziei CBS 650.93]